VSDLNEQLEDLRRRVAKIDRKYEGPPPEPVPDPRRPEKYFVEEYLEGSEVETEHGKHFETERLFEAHRRHGSMEIDSLERLPEDLLGPISNGEAPPSPPTRWAFLDTETTGLAGGSGTYAFLIGVGRITAEGFRVRQFFMRDYGEEPSLMHALAGHLKDFDVLVTYNGKTYDVPLLETRYRMTRMRPPFSRMAHLDLLFGARRLWRLRFESCRLMDLERQIFGIEREGDIPGELIPYVYFEYLRAKEAFRLVPIFHHNAIDILSLACLTGVVPFAFRSPADTPLNHGAELVGLARWLRQSDQLEEALDMFRRAVDADLPDELLFRTLWDIGLLEKKRGNHAAAVTAFSDLSTCRNPYRVRALEELAKHYEHHEKNLSMALEFTLAAIEIEDAEELRRRQARLERRLSGPMNRRLL
jgi:uncharacterized protein YprB with RNaseH-like and TPR domain